MLGKVYEDVSFPLKQKAVFAQDPNNKSANDPESKAEYWYYDSNETSLYLKQDSARQSYYLAGNGTKDDASLNRGADNSTNGKGYGFFPFNETVTGSAPQYNYGFGAKLQFDFTLTEDGKVHDDYRIEYLRKHIEQIKLAADEGAEMMGYCPWSAIDLVSTHEGITKRYGFIYVNRDEFDMKDLARYRKDSFYWYKKVIETNGEDLS